MAFVLPDSGGPATTKSADRIEFARRERVLGDTE